VKPNLWRNTESKSVPIPNPIPVLVLGLVPVLVPIPVLVLGLVLVLVLVLGLVLVLVLVLGLGLVRVLGLGLVRVLAIASRAGRTSLASPGSPSSYTHSCSTNHGGGSSAHPMSSGGFVGAASGFASHSRSSRRRTSGPPMLTGAGVFAPVGVVFTPSTTSRTNVSILPMNPLRLPSPCSIRLSACSHAPVIEGLLTLSSTTLISEMPRSVATSALPSRST
jgi:hypothetical protein